MDTNPKIDDLVLYDGSCGFCNRSVQLLMKHEKARQLHYAPLQSPIGQHHLTQHGLSKAYNESIVFITQGKVHLKSKAVFRLLPFMKSYCRILSPLQALPLSLTDKAYDWIAQRRHKITSSTTTCEISRK